MIESLKDMKHGKSNSYEGIKLERTASQILHHMEYKDSEDSLESTKARVLCKRCRPSTFTVIVVLTTTLKRTPERSTEPIVFST